METVYQIVPAGMRPLYLLLPIFLLLVAVMGLLGLTAYGSQRARFVLSDAGLDFRGDVYGRRVPWAALRVQEARVVDLSREADLQPRSRRWGTGLPGYAVGWWLGAPVGIMTAFIASMVGTGVGMYAGRRIAGLLLE